MNARPDVYGSILSRSTVVNKNDVLLKTIADVNGVLRKVSIIAHYLVWRKRKPGYDVASTSTTLSFVVPLPIVAGQSSTYFRVISGSDSNVVQKLILQPGLTKTPPCFTLRTRHGSHHESSKR
jgi:predicted HAD superfamily phosphohydrolase